MATTKAEVKAEQPIDMNRLVSYTPPIDMRNLNGTRYVSVNGENYRIKTGETVMIPAYIAAVLIEQDKNDIAIQRKIQHTVNNPMVADAN